MQINKTAAAVNCEKSVAAQNFRCSFEVTVTNTGDAPFNGPIVFTDETNFQTTAEAQGATCDTAGGLDHRCEIAAATIPPKGSTKFLISNVLPFASVPINTPPGECKLNNTITIASPRGEGPAATSAATAQLPAIANEGKVVPCDPPGLRLSKTAQGCSAVGTGFECGYKLTVTSAGPDPFQDAPIHIEERLPAGATVKATSKGWSCSGSGGSTRCSTEGKVTLAVGASLDLELTVALPKTAVRPGTCDVTNNAEIVQPGRDMTQAGTQLKASASARIVSPECGCPSGQQYNAKLGECIAPPAPVCLEGYTGVYPNCTPVVAAVPPPPACTAGMVLLPTGRCGCPPGQEYNAAQRACGGPLIRICPDGWTGEYPDCVRVTRMPPLTPGIAQPQTCPDGSKVRPGATCPCPAGQVLVRGVCRQRYTDPPRCPTGLIGTPPNCTCPPGQVLTRTGQCRADLVLGCPADRPVGKPPYCCPRGTQYINGSCRSGAPTPPPPPQQQVCAAGMVGTPPNCTCPPGQVLTRTGQCRADLVLGCPADRPVGKPPYCCPRGTQYINGSCRSSAPTPTPPPQQQVCAAGMVGTPPNCTCPPGQVLTRTGQCRADLVLGCPADRPVGKPPYCCPRGTQYINGSCRSSASPTPTPPPQQQVCARGMVGKPPNCICPPGQVLTRTGQCRADLVVGCPADRPVGKPPYCCPRGTQYINNSCRSSASPTPTPPPQQQACTGGRVGRPPNCNCPPGTSFSTLLARRTRGRSVCASATTTAPIPSTPKPTPQVQCSMERVCAQWGKGPAGGFPTCARYEMKRICGSGSPSPVR